MIVSTPHGMNMFYTRFGQKQKNKEIVIFPLRFIGVKFLAVMNKWKKETIANTSEQQFNTEFECEFLGSIDTLISPSKLRVLTYRTPLQSNAGLDVYEQPKEGNTYLLTADVARGTSNDYSAYIVFDVTQVPYRMVAKYRDNEIKPLIFPQKIYQVARAYNQAFVLIEVNDIGEQVANAMQFDMEYDNHDYGIDAWKSWSGTWVVDFLVVELS